MNKLDSMIDIIIADNTTLNECVEVYLSVIKDFTIISREELSQLMKAKILTNGEKKHWQEILDIYKDKEYFDYETELPIEKADLLKRLNVVGGIK